jgi:hypothetical protein
MDGNTYQPYFEEDQLLYRAWRMQATSEGLKVRVAVLRMGRALWLF